MQVQGMDRYRFFLDAIDCEAIKIGSMAIIRTAFLVMETHQKLSRPSFKNYVNISLCEACFLKLKFPWRKNFLSL